MDIATLVDLVLAVLVVEALVLAWARRRAARGPSFVALLPNLAAGLSLVLAVRATADGRSVIVIGGLLALAGLCHAADLAARLKR